MGDPGPRKDNHDEEVARRWNCKINGKTYTVESEDDTPLLWVIRDELGLTGTKYGCGIAQCGACSVLVDGQVMRSCVTPVAGVAGKQITTIEGDRG